MLSRLNMYFSVKQIKQRIVVLSYILLVYICIEYFLIMGIFKDSFEETKNGVILLPNTPVEIPQN